MLGAALDDGVGIRRRKPDGLQRGRLRGIDIHRARAAVDGQAIAQAGLRVVERRSVVEFGGHPFHQQQFLVLQKRRVTRQKRRRLAQIKRVERAGMLLVDRRAPVDDGGRDLRRPVLGRPQRQEEPQKLFGARHVQIELRGFRDHIDVDVGRGERRDPWTGCR